MDQPAGAATKKFGIDDGILAALVALVTVAQLVYLYVQGVFTSSLWIDETITRWIVSGEISDLVERSRAFQGQSPVYYLLVWLSTRIFHGVEFASRFPSVIALAYISWALWRIGHQTWGRPESLLAILLLTVSPNFVLCHSARPYGVALALSLALIVTASRIAEDEAPGKLRDWGAYTALALLLAMVTPTFILLHTAILLGWLLNGNLRSPAFLARMAACYVPILAMESWTISLAMRWSSDRDLVFGGTPTLSNLLQMIAPSYFTIPFAVALILCLSRRQGSDNGSRKRSFLEQLAYIALILAPALLWFAASLGKIAGHDRYILWIVLGQILVFAGIHRMLLPAGLRQTYIVLFSVLLFALSSRNTWGHEDWRESFEVIRGKMRPDDVLYISSGLIESNRTAFLDNHANHEYLATPARAYSVANPIFPLPATPSLPEMRKWLEDHLKPALPQGREVYFILLNNNIGSDTFSVQEYLSIFHAWGLKGKVLRAGSAVWLLSFQGTGS